MGTPFTNTLNEAQTWHIICGFCFLFFVCLFVCLFAFGFLGPHLWHMEVPRLEVELELQNSWWYSYFHLYKHGRKWRQQGMTDHWNFGGTEEKRL